jgi:two-component system, chemotaxis family, protein-glutamate methylesterase/glutaminase
VSPAPDSVVSAGRSRVLVVDDDAAYRRIVSLALEGLPSVQLAGVAPTLAIARRRIAEGDIDAVTLDVVMRDECGLELLQWIGENYPRLVTILLTAGQSSAACRAVDALLLGAAAIVMKPSGKNAAQELRTALARELASVGQRSKPRTAPRPCPPSTSLHVELAAPREVIAIGASTGGPQVIMRFLRDLPAHFPVPLVITQHMPRTHLPYFVALLAEQSGRRVSAAHHGTVLAEGCAYVATGDGHLVLQRAGDNLVTSCDDGHEEHHCKPAVDPMFRSVARVCGAASIGVLMTGMGSDGALGALALREGGAPVVVQDRDTSVVWGMPGAAVAQGAADKVLPAEQLAQCVVAWTSGLQSARRTQRQ